MAADTLTDAQVETLRDVRYGRAIPWSRRLLVGDLVHSGLLNGWTFRGLRITPAGREALARHELGAGR